MDKKLNQYILQNSPKILKRWVIQTTKRELFIKIVLPLILR